MQPVRKRYCWLAVLALVISGVTLSLCLVMFPRYIMDGSLVDSLLKSPPLLRFECDGGLSKTLCASLTLSLILSGIASFRLLKNRSLRGSYLVMASVIMSLIVLSYVPVATRQEESTRMMECASRLKQLDIALTAYLDAHGGQLPDASQWHELLSPYVKDPSVFRCPSDHTGRYSYAMNSAIDPDLAANPVDLVLIFECKPSSPQSGGKELLDPRHSGGCNVLFPDLHIEVVCFHVIDGLRWTTDGPLDK
jgi:prepilin-type processing-associated H-X9-DG protein